MKGTIAARLFLILSHVCLVAISKVANSMMGGHVGDIWALMYGKFAFCVFVPATYYLANGDLRAKTWQKFCDMICCQIEDEVYN